MEFLRLTVAALIVTGLLLLGVIAGEFRDRQQPTLTTSVPVAVVFTGQYDRIELALRLFDLGGIDRLLISGVNPKAGLFPDTIADQFRFSEAARAALAAGRIRLSPDAADTFQNAAETACWLSGQADVTDVLLVTSSSHMPRASITLQRALPPGVRLHRVTPPETADDRAKQQTEFVKFAAAWVATLFPAGRRAAPHLRLCNGGAGP